MKSDLYIFFYVLANMFRTYDIYLFFETFFVKSKKNKSKIFSYAVFFLLITLVQIFIDIPILTLILNIACCMGLTFYYYADMKKRLLSMVFLFGLLCITEALIVVATGFFSFSFVEKGFYDSIPGVIAVPTLPFVFILLYRGLKRGRTDIKIPMSYCITAVFVPLLCTYISMLVFSIRGIQMWQSISIVVIMFAIMIFVFVLYEKQMKFFSEDNRKRILELQNEYYHKQLGLMMSAENATRSLRHDMKNHLLSILALAERSGDVVVAEYVDKLNHVFSPVKKSVSTGNVVIDSILNSKLSQASEKDIDLKIDIAIPEEFPIQDMDITVLLGNLLDNAIENFEKEAGKAIILKIKYDKGRLLINCENPYHGMLRRRRKFYYSAKGDEGNHGFGLRNIYNVVNKYKGDIRIKDENNMFRVELLLYVAS